MNGRLARNDLGRLNLGLAAALAFAAHLMLLALLSIAWGGERPRAWPKSTPLEVSLVTEVAPEAQAPPSPEPPAPSIAPEQGAPEEAAPPPTPAREPARLSPPEPTPARPAPSQPAPKPAPAAKPAPAKPAAAKPAPVAKPVAAKPAPAAPARPRSDRLAGLSLGTAGSTAGAATRPRGARLGDDFLKGLAADAPRRPTSAAPGAKPGPYPTASIVQAIARQIQPCADRQVTTGMPGANEIVSVLNIRLNRDGTLAATPTKVRQSGIDDGNERYAQRVVDLGIAAFKGCSPLKLPEEYYQTASGGWNNINYRWQVR